MKIIWNGETYLMHWETRKFSPEKGKNTELELVATDCIIRKVQPGGGMIPISRGHVSQTSCDPANAVTARRKSFLKAIGLPNMRGGLVRGLRKALGHEYNRTCRVTSGPGSISQQNRNLRKRIAMLEKEIQAVKDLTAVVEEVNKENATV